MNIIIGAYEAKTKLSELLRAVKSGKRYTIKLRDEAVADLVPSNIAKQNDVAAAVMHMNRLMDLAPPIPNVDIKALIEEGRD